MRDIEVELDIYHRRYIDFRDGKIPVPDHFTEEQKRNLAYNKKFRSRGVQKSIRYFPWFITIVWIGMLIYQILGGNNNMQGIISVATIDTGVFIIIVVSILIGFFIGIIVGFVFGRLYRAATGKKYENLETAIVNLSLSINTFRQKLEDDKKK